jgi:ketosteroid isomerase-like protein
MWKSVFDSGIAAASLETADVEADGSLAYETGRYEMKLKDGKVADRGKYVVVWKRTGNEWRIHRDIWNTNMPAGK